MRGLHILKRIIRCSKSSGCTCLAKKNSRSRVEIHMLKTCHLILVCYNFRLGANVNQLAAVALSRLQEELAKDGRNPSLASQRMHGKSFSRKAAIMRSSEKPRGNKSMSSVSLVSGLQNLSNIL